jgi:hypothetical protein
MVTDTGLGGRLDDVVVEVEEVDEGARVDVVEPVEAVLWWLARPKTATATAAPSRQTASASAARRRGRLRSGEDDAGGGRWAIPRPYATTPCDAGLPQPLDVPTKRRGAGDPS